MAEIMAKYEIHYSGLDRHNPYEEIEADSVEDAFAIARDCAWNEIGDQLHYGVKGHDIEDPEDLLKDKTRDALKLAKKALLSAENQLRSLGVEDDSGELECAILALKELVE